MLADRELKRTEGGRTGQREVSTTATPFSQEVDE